MAIEGVVTPLSLATAAEEELPIEVTFGNEDSANVTENPDGSVTIVMSEGNPGDGTAHGANLAEVLADQELSSLASQLVAEYEADRMSRKDWERTYIQGLDLMGLKFEDRSTPWEGACGVFHPMLTDAVVRFEAQVMQEIYPAGGPAKTVVVGPLTDERVQQANRVGEYMNYMLTQTMTEYRSETERLLFALPVAGSAFRKIYHDPVRNRPASMYVPAEDFVVNYGSSDLETAERATHYMKRSPNWVKALQARGFYRDVDLPPAAPDPTDIAQKYQEMTGQRESYEFDHRHTLLEMMVDLDLPGFEAEDGVALPYVVTIDKTSQTVLSIYRNWKEDDPTKQKRQHAVHYSYLPGFGFYGFGLVHMIGGLTKSATSVLRQLVDSGTLANLPGGLKTRGLRIKGDDTPIMPGEFRDVDVPGGSIRDNLAFLPYKEPSGVLYQLLGDLVEEGKRFASAADVKVSDMSGEAPVGTTLAILERELKVVSAVQARVHAAVGKELRILAEVIAENAPERYPYDPESHHSPREDFDDRVDVIPVSNPNAGTMAQRIMQYQAALELSRASPEIYDLPYLHRKMVEVLGIDNADKVVPMESDIHPTDPVSENMNILTSKPVKAFIYQDHEAHIQVHLSAMQNPEIQKLVSQSPTAGQMQAAMAAHIAEHVAFAYRQKIEQELGVELPAPDEELPEDIELRISRLAAPAAAQLTGKAQQQAAAQEAAEKAQDPVVQMQQAELEIDRMNAQTRAAEAQANAQAKLGRIMIDREKLEAREREKAAEIAARMQLAENKDRVEAEMEGFRAGFKMIMDMIDSNE